MLTWGGSVNSLSRTTLHGSNRGLLKCRKTLLNVINSGNPLRAQDLRVEKPPLPPSQEGEFYILSFIINSDITDQENVFIGRFTIVWL